MNKTKYRFMNLDIASRNLIAQNAKKFIAKNFPFLNMKLTDENKTPKGVSVENKKIQYFLAEQLAVKKESSPFKPYFPYKLKNNPRPSALLSFLSGSAGCT